MAGWALLLLRLVVALLLSVAAASSSAGFLRPYFAAVYDDERMTSPTPVLPTSAQRVQQQGRRHLTTSCPAGKFDNSGTCDIW